METALTLEELANASKSWDAGLTEVPLPRDDAKFTENGLLCEGNVFQATDECRRQLFDRIEAPGWYWKNHSRSFQAQGLNEHLKRGHFGSRPTALIGNGELITIFRGELKNLPNSSVVTAICDELRKEGEGLSVSRISRDAERLELELVSPNRATLVRAGDIIQAGVSLVHSRYGNEATQVQSYMLRLVCANGMTRRECISQNTFQRTRRLAADNPAARELQLDQIRRLVRHNWNTLEGQLETIKRTNERKVQVEGLLERSLQRARLSGQDMRERVLRAWRVEGEENTFYGAVNGLTRVATHDRSLSARQRRTLALLAGLLAFSNEHLCERCWSVLTGRAVDERRAA
jgi:hypothetical protein